MSPTMQPRILSPKTEIGWREWIGLPGLGIKALKAKIDTGARTSALHAIDHQPFMRSGEPWISFRVPLANLSPDQRCAARIIDEREIKNTSGQPELRYIVATTLVLGAQSWNIEVSLANRERMEFEIILGRTAIRRRRLLINPGRSFLIGPPSLPESFRKDSAPLPDKIR